jgi:ribosomal protein S18
MDLKEAAQIVKHKISHLDIENLAISNYNKGYLKRYQQNIDFYLDAYCQLLSRAISKLDKPINQSIILDYGGGSGILSLLAVTLGFKKVIYNDLYEVSVDDFKTTSQQLEIDIYQYITGDIGEVIELLKNSNDAPDLICSFDVLEHIYDLKEWFKQLKGFNHTFYLFFKTSANGYNPIIKKRLQKMQFDAEYHSKSVDKDWKEIDLHKSFLEERKKIIAKHFTQLSQEEIINLATQTRGLRENDINKEISYFISSGKMRYKMIHPTNTCDPYTGNWVEKIIDVKKLCSYINTLGFHCHISNSYYSYSNNKWLNLPKYILNLTIRLLGKKNLVFSPSYTLEVIHKR